MKKNIQPSIIFAIQASSTSWSGTRDLCMNQINGLPAILRTIKNISKLASEHPITIIAPKFDEFGKFDDLLKFKQLKKDKVKVFYGYNDSPLDRMVAAFKNRPDGDYVVRVDGLNFAIDPKYCLKMCQYAYKNHLDCLKFPDDYPVHFTFDIFRLGALRKARKMLRAGDEIFKVHPKFYMIKNKNNFKILDLSKPPIYDELTLKKTRKKYKSVFFEREGSISNRIKVGDTLNYHYELAARYVKKTDNVLDIACGEGYGTRVLSLKARQTTGADSDRATISKAKYLHQGDDIKFEVQDATRTTCLDNSFDLIASMETIEHIKDVNLYLNEMKRILKDSGLFILSTPQNSQGRIPMNNNHIREYSLLEIKKIISKYFKIEKIIGLKRGLIYFDSDPRGTNTILICKKGTKHAA